MHVVRELLCFFVPMKQAWYILLCKSHEYNNKHWWGFTISIIDFGVWLTSSWYWPKCLCIYARSFTTCHVRLISIVVYMPHLISRRCVLNQFLKVSVILVNYLLLLSYSRFIMAVQKWVNIGSGNGVLPIRRRVLTWNNANLFSISSLRTDINKHKTISIPNKACKKCQCKVLTILFKLQCINTLWSRDAKWR